MLDLKYLAAVLATVFVINLALRAVPFAILQPLRKSRFVNTMAAWMPVGIGVILAASTFRSVAVGHLAYAAFAGGTDRGRPPARRATDPAQRRRRHAGLCVARQRALTPGASDSVRVGCGR